MKFWPQSRAVTVKILRKMTGSNSKLDLVHVDVHTKFGLILTSIKGHNSVRILHKRLGNNLKS